MAKVVKVQPVIGMEVHVELCTAGKMFSRCPNAAAAGAERHGPNELIDPVVLGLPGALPVLNREAISMAMMVGLALNCRVSPLTKWDRKSYFYPDLPKGYQISQYDLPVCADGFIEVPACGADGRPDPESVDVKRITIVRAHLEEDAGKLLHEAPGGGAIEGSIVDLNRAGTPLLEIVTAPDFDNADRCVSFAQALRGVCRALGVTLGVMQKGHMRFEPNINCLLTLDDGRLVKTPIVEVKNLNSFRSLRGAIEFELREQVGRWEKDGRELSPSSKTTRGWDDHRAQTTVQREKEDAADYRYFPDPDLLPVRIGADWIDAVRAKMPPTPMERARKYAGEYGLSVKDAAALTDERAVSDLYDGAIDAAAALGVSRHRAAKAAAVLLLQSGLKRANERTAAAIAADGQHAVPTLVSDLGVSAAQIAQIIALRESGDISAAGADDVFGALCADGGAAGRDAREVAAERGLILVRDENAINAWVDQAIRENDKAAADVRAGKEQAIGRIVGAAMKASAGKGDAGELRKRILERLRG